MLLSLLLALGLPTVQDPIPVREVLAVGRLGERQRSPVYTDALEARLAAGEWSAPAEGDTILSATGDERTWERVAAGENGWFGGRPFRGGWAFAAVEVPVAGPWRLDASGHAAVLVDGEPRGGDHYSLGTTRAPLHLETGRHELLFLCGRGRLRATLEPAPAAVYLEDKDRTLPDVIRGEGGRLLLGHLVANATPARAEGLAILAHVAGVEPVRTDLPPLGPSAMRKCALEVAVPIEPDGDALEVRLELIGADGAPLHESALSLDVRAPDQGHARTFRSSVDGSVQYFAVTPPRAGEGGESSERPALVLTLHGAGVEARGQAGSYAPKDWCVVVAPTNRRPFGFDWEDWGRIDALEVLALAEERYGTDPRRTYLTGHSMGGHGVWQVGAHFPDRFAAIAPSAGWRDFWSYAGGATFPEDDAVGGMLARAANASRTTLLERNYLHGGVYVLHGDRDNNVPVREARAMRERLASFHPNFAYYERPGAGHWWGNACVDWPPLFAFLRENALPDPTTLRDIEFATVNPAISDRCHWLRVEAQIRPLEPSSARATLDPEKREVRLELENVARLELDLAAFAATPAAGDAEPVLPAGAPLVLRVGEVEVEVPFEDASTPLALGRGQDGVWRARRRLTPWYKGAHRAGPFKDAFRKRMVFVHGTAGTPQENAWAYRKARYDHETWRYRGNGAVDVIADAEFTPEAYADRGVVLYGNRDTNTAWSSLLGEGAFDVRRGSLRIAGRTFEGDDVALLALYPRADSGVASVAVVAGTGLAGCRATDHLPYFVSGVGYPDWTVIGAEFLTEGLEGFRGAGFFRDDWSTELGAEAAWR